MYVWLSMLIVIVILRFMVPDQIGKKKTKLVFLTLAYFVIVFVVGSRSALLTDSTDLHNYYTCYGRAMSMPLNELVEKYYTMEEGYLILNKIVAWLVPWNFFIVYFEVAFCTLVMFWFIYRNTDNVFFGVIIYICAGPWQFFLTGFRQAFAISICLIALELLKKQKQMTDIAAVLLILLATTMHQTAWVFLTMLLIRNIKLNKRFFYICGFVTIILLFFVEDIVRFGNDIFEKDYSAIYIGNLFGGFVPIFIYLATLILCRVITEKKDDTFYQENRFFMAILTIGLCIYILRYKSLIMERMSFYFTPVVCPLLANAISKQPNKIVRNIAYVVCIGFLCGLFIYRCVTQYGEYHFFWEYLEGVQTS